MASIYGEGVLIVIILVQLFPSLLAFAAVDPTQGFVAVPLSDSNLEVQWPYDLQKDQRYSFEDGVHKLWVYSSDKPHSKDSHTRPRTEIRITGHDYSSGVWQFEGQGFVPSGTTGVCVMQVFGASGRATTMMVRVYNGALSAYRAKMLPDIYGRWFKLNVIHDADAGKLEIYVDGSVVYQGAGHGGKSHYFKFGVYTQDDASKYMESRWKDIKVFKKQ
ncbi:Citrate-binding protein [Linum grandiflorum]